MGCLLSEQSAGSSWEVEDSRAACISTASSLQFLLWFGCSQGGGGGRDGGGGGVGGQRLNVKTFSEKYRPSGMLISLEKNQCIKFRWRPL